MGGRGGGRRRAISVDQLEKRLEAAVGREYANTLHEISEALTIFEAQLAEGETLDVRTELLRLSRTLKRAAGEFRSWGD